MNQDSSLSVGKKIRNYRQRAKISQFDLEIEINASQGSISRIENDMVRPTKETLSKIANALNLKSSEIVDLLGLKILTTEELILAMQSLLSSLDLSTTLQTAVDIMFGLFPNYNGGIVFLQNEDNKNTFRARTISKQIPNLQKFLSFLPFNLNNINIDVTKHKNIAIDTIKFNKVHQSDDLYEFAKDIVSKFVSDSVQRVSGFKYGISVPMEFEENVIGICFYTKSVKEEYSESEVKLLKLLTGQITMAIVNARKYEELKAQVNLLRKELNKD